MIILIIAGIFPPDIGGPAGYLPKLCRSLKDKGHVPIVLTFSDVTRYTPDLNLDYKIVRVSRKLFLPLRELKTIFIGLKLALTADIIFSNGNDFKAMIIGFLTFKKRIHKIVGDTAWERAQNRKWYKKTIDEYQSDRKSFKLKLLDFVRALPLKTANKVITPSNYLKKIVQGWGVRAERICVINNAFQPLPTSQSQDFDNILALKKNNFKIMLTICRLVPWKGVDTLITILNHFPELALVIAGDGPLLSELELFAIKQNVQNRVLILGKIDRGSIKHIFELSDFFILNSSYEGLPHVVLEAMSCNKLVLASAVGGTIEVVENKITGLTFEYGNHDEIVDSVRIALNSDNSHLIENAALMIEHSYSYAKMISETEQVFLDLIL